MAKKHLLTATLPDGSVKTIGPTATRFTHYWRIVALLENGKTEVFWGHSQSLAEATRKRTAAGDAARQRGWRSFEFEVVEVVRSAGAHSTGSGEPLRQAQDEPLRQAQDKLKVTKVTQSGAF